MTGLNQDGEPVISWEGLGLVARREPADVDADEGNGTGE
jgi:hypothetical protein